MLQNYSQFQSSAALQNNQMPFLRPEYIVTEEHKFDLREVSSKTVSKKFIFFEFEADNSSGTHKVNFTVAQKAEGIKDTQSVHILAHSYSLLNTKVVQRSHIA